MKVIWNDKIYEVRRSGKGYSETESMWFNKNKALEHAAYMQDLYKDSIHKTNFRVYEHTTRDIIVTTDELWEN